MRRFDDIFRFLIRLDTTSLSASCGVSLLSYDKFYSWYCGSGNASTGLTESCNITKYSFNGSNYYVEYIYDNYHSITSTLNYTHWYQSGTTTLTTGGTAHNYLFNTTNIFGGNLFAQGYGMEMVCYDVDWNEAYAYTAININVTS